MTINLIRFASILLISAPCTSPWITVMYFDLLLFALNLRIRLRFTMKPSHNLKNLISWWGEKQPFSSEITSSHSPHSTALPRFIFLFVLQLSYRLRLTIKTFLTPLLLNKYARWWFDLTHSHLQHFFSTHCLSTQCNRCQFTNKTVLNTLIIAVCSCSEWLHANRSPST